MEKNYISFTEDMKKDYTILVPTMLPMHFKMIISVLRTYGYNMELLDENGPQVADTGLKYVHNDTCYPAILIIGQFMRAILSGKYDPHKVALVMFQTGGGCRASNYISLLRKALKKAGYIVQKSREEDSRRNFVELTEKGRHLVEESCEYFDTVDQQMYQGFTEDKKRNLCEYLDRIYSNMERLKNAAM